MWNPITHYLPLLGTSLKSELMLDLLETYEVDVIYQYDRTHENLPDSYHAQLAELGMEMRFDQDQNLAVVFFDLTEENARVSLSDSDILIFNVKSEVKSHAERNNTPFREGSAELFGVMSDWIRLDAETHSLHYEYREGGLAKVTLSLPDRCAGTS